MTDSLVRLDNVSFHYDPRRPVFAGADLDLAPGERVALAGPNGSGKTTLLHLIVGLLRPTGGRIEAFGRSRQSEADFVEVRRRAGLLFQDAEDQLFCPTVAEDVAFGPLNLGHTPDEVRDIVARTLAALGLSGYEDRITYRLSGGEKRLVSLAAVLAMRPEVLLLDEPIGGLDEASADRLLQIIMHLPQSMLIVSHDRGFLQKVVHRAVCVCDTRLAPLSLGALSGGGGGLSDFLEAR